MDCCADYAVGCAAQNTSSSDFVQAVTDIIADQVSCEVPPHSSPARDETGYRLITRCLVTWNNDRTRQKCEGPQSDDDLLQLVPVSLQTYMTFKNIYCAQCNRKNIRDVTAWPFQAICGFQTPRIPSNSTFIQRIQILMTNCMHWYFTPTTLKSTAVRICNANAINTCAISVTSTMNMALRDACKYYDAEIMTLLNQEVYKNPHCYLCSKLFQNTYNQLTATLELFNCPVYEQPVRRTFRLIPPISVLIDFGTIDELLSYEEETNEQTNGVTCLNGQVCGNNSHLTCPLDTFNASLFDHLPDGSVVYLPQNKTFTPNEFLKPNNTSIQLCSFSNAVESEMSYSPGQSITSTVGLTLSVISLLFSFITYVKFKSLRTSIFSKLIMSICISITVAQLLLLVSGAAVSNSKACTAVAVLGHYMWLVVFTHSITLASDLYRRFGLTQTFGTTSERSQTLMRFLFFAWGFPLTIVIPCLGVYLSGLEYIPLSYGTSDSCWIGDGITTLYVFGLPIALSIIINGVLFILIVAGIRTKRNAVNQSKKDQRSQIKADIVICLKMSSLLGFTWLFGFLAAFVGVEALLYMSIVLNSLQGVFIFIAFMCNKRVLILWHNSCTCRPCTTRSTSKTKTKLDITTSTTTVPTGSRETTTSELIPMTESSGNSKSEPNVTRW